MTFLEDMVLVLHVLAALAIIGVVMLQHGKGADMGAGFGAGASATVFGAAGSGNFLTRTTTIAAIVFFVTSFSLAYFAKERAVSARDVGIPVQAVEQDVGAMGDEELMVPVDDEAVLMPEMAEMAPGEAPGQPAESDAGTTELPELE